MKFIDPIKLLSKIEFDKYGNITTTMSGLRIAMGESEVEVEPVKHGRWVNDNGLYKCSACNTFTVTGWANCIPIDQMNKTMRYCNNCGAKMNLEE